MPIPPGRQKITPPKIRPHHQSKRPATAPGQLYRANESTLQHAGPQTRHGEDPSAAW